MTKAQIYIMAAGVVTGIVADIDAFVGARKADPNVKWEWWPFCKRILMGILAGFGGGLGVEVGG